ncbi:hypothetical protein [Roseobacter sp. OBYS 0001]|uniref:hypothetical protein n=1 Tax=Roseobacter sp. OBYS 0001 TaxID=882651 RepID=UPI001C7E6AB5|nr:hypothetical protein [Roseobacter sp. OBYS 0001]
MAFECSVQPLDNWRLTKGNGAAVFVEQGPPRNNEMVGPRFPTAVINLPAASPSAFNADGQPDFIYVRRPAASIGGFFARDRHQCFELCFQWTDFSRSTTGKENIDFGFPVDKPAHNKIIPAISAHLRNKLKHLLAYCSLEKPSILIGGCNFTGVSA